MSNLKAMIDSAVFADDDHKDRFETLRRRAGLDTGRYYDVYRETLFYLLSLDKNCYNHISDLYDFKNREIIPGGVNKEWQTSSSVKTTRLAFNLFTAGCMWCDEGTERYCAVDEIFSCNYAPYFLEAVKLWKYSAF